MRKIWFAVWVVGLAGCTGRIVDDGRAGPAAPQPAAPQPADPTTTQPPADPLPTGPLPTGQPDAGVPVSCATPGACPCFSNADCPAGTACHTESDGKLYCAPGGRGTGTLGSPCGGEADCQSGVCYTPSTGPSVCTSVCTSTECAGSSLPVCTPLNTQPPVKACL